MILGFLGVVLIVIVLAGVGVLYIKKVPHGWVLFKTGLILKFLPALDRYPVVPLRKSIEEYVEKKLPGIRKSLPVTVVKDIKVPTRHGYIKARIYDNKNNKPDYLIVMIHGGGWCIGSINTYEEVSRRLVIETGLPLIALDYSLAPEFKFPHAHEECLDATNWIAGHSKEIAGHSLPLILIGDSAGGNLILSTYYESTAEVQSRIKKLVPVYPVADCLNKDYQSAEKFGKGYYLTDKSMQQFTEAMIGTPEHLNDKRLSPISYPHSSGFPETFVITAEFDPLRDQGEAYATKLKAEGSSIILKRYKGTTHAFFGLKDFGKQGVQAIKDINLFVRNQPILGAIY